MQIFGVQNDCDKLRMIMITLSINNINTWQMRFADNYKRGEPLPFTKVSTESKIDEFWN